MAMELSIWSSYYIELSPEDAILRLKQNGLNSVELSDEHGLAILSRSSDPVSEGRKFGEYAKSIGMDSEIGVIRAGARGNAVILNRDLEILRVIG